jgi:hypothetical protein
MAKLIGKTRIFEQQFKDVLAEYTRAQMIEIICWFVAGWRQSDIFPLHNDKKRRATRAITALASSETCFPDKKLVEPDGIEPTTS